MAKEPLHETIGSYIAITSVIIPGILVSGFMPDWNVFNFPTWLLIATIGAAVGSAISTKRLVLGSLAGAMAGAGALLGLYYYVAIRAALTGSGTFLSLELLLGAAVGAAPGIVLYFLVARISKTED